MGDLVISCVLKGALYSVRPGGCAWASRSADSP